jgi:hypothetical protein
MYLSTLVTVAVFLLIIGTLAFFKQTQGTQIVTATLMVLIQLMYSISIGPLCKSLIRNSIAEV